ncbi:MAG: 1-acyl-sn-glycerol-3-phosphate acyltransferase [Nanoarchaeota archaeon]|nr:1-acyl-sn-glycerol-3-phosphate acyltransferase [Nanoarchaeota archaeon]
MAYQITSRVISLLIKPWTGLCTGIHNIPADKGVILAANHSSYLDHFIVGCSIFLNLNKAAYYLAKKEHFDTFFQRKWHQFLPAIPIDRETCGREALSKAVEHLKKGNLIMIYPEGTRTITGKMNRAKTGVARLALAAKAPVIPMGITNTFKIWPKEKKIPRFGKKADLNIGNPLYFDKYYGKDDDKKALRKVTTLIMNEIAKLSHQKYEFDQE